MGLVYISDHIVAINPFVKRIPDEILLDYTADLLQYFIEVSENANGLSCYADLVFLRARKPS